MKPIIQNHFEYDKDNIIEKIIRELQFIVTYRFQDENVCTITHDYKILIQDDIQADG